ncbi:hypothetical protein [Caballeronia novacaledonica]|uniref:Uncharacterized protein n=1 Tax=Caballeronia novacaledonica TaxID=1544861 RepID=A0AA37IKW7_9BURK|nr:hypothetical protein [Caballeronia novacaledonica]GJH30579.1 hypothetical protein CBA19CS42_38705 [Caballeronia novacaledonica]
MNRVIPFKRVSVTAEKSDSRAGGCAHRHIRLDQHGGVVTCTDCNATLAPFWALSMLSEQYSLAMSQIERLSARLSLADARLLELSAQLDALRGDESPSKPSSTEP